MQICSYPPRRYKWIANYRSVNTIARYCDSHQQIFQAIQYQRLLSIDGSPPDPLFGVHNMCIAEYQVGHLQRAVARPTFMWGHFHMALDERVCNPMQFGTIFCNMDGLLTVEEAAERLRLHPGTVRSMLRAGTIHGLKIGTWRIPESSLQEFIAAGMRKPPASETPDPEGHLRRTGSEGD